MFTIGEMQIHLISDGLVQVDAGGAFGLVPRTLWSQYLPSDEDNLVPMLLHNLVIRTQDQVVVVDTGIGDKLPPRARAIWRLERPEGGLLAGLARLGIQAEDVNLVINTHLHLDHCGGNTRLDADGRVIPTFPNAEHVVHQREYADAMRPNERTRATYLVENYEPLMRRGQLRLLADDEEELVPGLFAVRTPGHTPGHLAVRLQARDEHAAFVCDLASYAVHFERLGWMTAYDVEPLVTLETKRAWQQWALETGALIIFPHDHQIPAGRLTQPAEGRPVIAPVPVAYS